MADGPASIPRRSTAPPNCGPATGDVERLAVFGRVGAKPDAFVERAMRIWGAGDYERISSGFRHEAEDFVARLKLTRDANVLDAACGSGNVAIPAARGGARVTGCDIVPDLLEAAAERAAREGLVLGLDHANVEALPYGNARFDVVLSMFGVMFAARPDCVMSELARVTKPGGRVVLANWTADGFAGRVLAIHTSFVPSAPGVPNPLAWGDEAAVAARFDKNLWDVRCERRVLTFRYPFTPAGTAELFRGSFGPTVRTFELLDEDRRALFAAELRDMWMTHHRRGAPMTEVESEYLQVNAVRR